MAYVTARLVQTLKRVESRDVRAWREELNLTLCSGGGVRVRLGWSGFDLRGVLSRELGLKNELLWGKIIDRGFVMGYPVCESLKHYDASTNEYNECDLISV